jgi:hypothetical protein
MASINGTAMPPAGSITDNSSVVWTLSGTTLLANGNSSATNVVLVLWFDDALYYKDNSNSWYRYTPSGDPGTYMTWTIGSAVFQFVKGKISWGNTAGQTFMVQHAMMEVDSSPQSEQSSVNVSVPIGGSTVTFPTPYHRAPFVTAIAISATPLIATVSSITSTNFHVQVYNTSGTDVGGTVSWSAIGD